MKKFILLFFLLLLYHPNLVFAADHSDVVINEIAWMGTTHSANDEWLELKNNTTNQIIIDGWNLQSADGKLKIKLKGAISPNGFYLMERTDDTSVPNIPADLIYTGALSNNGMDLKLYDNLNNLIDEINCTGKWFAGDNATKQTMEKTDTGWQTSADPGGTPRAQNSAGLAEAAATVKTIATEPIKTANDQIKTTTYPNGIFINEILPDPKGPDETNEWIELYNSNNSEIDLSDWQLQDTIGTITTYTIPQNTKISAGGFLVLKRPDTKIMLNNDQDGLNLLTPDKKTEDSMAFVSALLDQSYNKTGSGWQWSTTLTPGAANIISAAYTKPKEKLNNKVLPKNNNSVKNKNIEAGLADISQTISTNQEGAPPAQTANPWFLFFTALAITIILAFIIIFIKLKIHPAKH